MTQRGMRGTWRTLVLAQAVCLVAAAASAGNFSVKFNGTERLRFESDGDVVLASGWVVEEARLHEWTSELTEREDVAEFIIRNGQGQVVALLDSKRGNLYLRGTMEEVSWITANYLADEFFIFVGMAVRLLIDEYGNMDIRGSVTEATCTAQRQDVVDQYDDLGYDYFDDYFPEVACYKFVTATSYVDPSNGKFTFAALDCNHVDRDNEPLDRPHSAWQWDETVSKMFLAVRDEYAEPIYTTSAYRCPIKNNTEGNRRGKHAYGRAFDYQQMTGGEQSVPDTSENWEVALDAHTAGLDPNRILLYNQDDSDDKTLQQFYVGGWSASSLPPGWTSISHGHCDSGEPQNEPN